MDMSIPPTESSDVEERVSLWWRAMGAVALSMLIAVTQVGPALACAVFDGSGRPGCPAYFLNHPSELGSRTGETRNTGGTRDDCSIGPSFLLSDPTSLKIPASLDSRATVDESKLVSATDARAAVHVPSMLGGTSSLSRIVGLQGRHVYLATRRLRI